ncbi:DUF7350 domain-containing protein [Haloferax volcanii]|uniref:DUF7350 domain-containing protein n=1 Tax=Haloferax volcanii TaxID=2246 RepID=A0A558FNQ5_HALVO|nr:hypothetical protein [Haloferax volcanii]TVT87152.1 hypothetical protein FQA18_19440 [Haloferax volcanii]
MRRRTFFRTVGGLSVGGLAGCLGGVSSGGSGAEGTESNDDSTASSVEPPLVEDRPDAVYLPTHFEGMDVVGTQSAGDYTCALAYTYPHRFWLVKPDGLTTVAVEPEDTVHVMPIVWHTETGLVPPDRNPQLTFTRDGETVAELSPWPMLSQPMGFHFGDNVALGGEGVFDIDVRVGSPSIRRTGALADSGGDVSFSFEFEFAASALDEIMVSDIPADEEGTAGAVEPMAMEMLPSTQVPAERDLPGTVRGTATSGDAVFVVTTLADATPFSGTTDETYVAVSPRTPHNRYMLPQMALSGTLRRDGETVFDGYLQSTLDPDLAYHYGAVVPEISAADEFTITVDSPPQAARHEGYETAFLDMDSMTMTLTE